MLVVVPAEQFAEMVFSFKQVSLTGFFKDISLQGKIYVIL